MSSSSVSDQKRRHSKKHARQSESSSANYTKIIFAALLLVVLGIGVIYLIKVDRDKADPTNRVARTLPDASSEDVDELETLMESGSENDLLAALVDIQNEKTANNPLLRYLNYSKQAAVAKRLLEADMEVSEKRYVAVTYLQSLAFSDWTNTCGKLNLEGVRDEVLEVAGEYENDQDPVIASHAKLALLVVHMADFQVSQDPIFLSRIQDQFDSSLDQILLAPEAAKIFVGVLFQIENDGESDLEETSLFMHIYSQLDSHVSTAAFEAKAMFRDLLFFRDFELTALVENLKDEDPLAREETERFFNVLSRNPDAGIQIYRKAIEVVNAYQVVGEPQLAELLEKRLREIAQEITDTGMREKVLSEIETSPTVDDDEPQAGLTQN